MASHIVPTIAPTEIAPAETAATAEPDNTALRALAGSVLQEFKERGYTLRHVIVLTSELVGLACDALRSSATPASKT
jgi:hypothetical protein